MNIKKACPQTSVETARDVQADKSLKTKAEKERIIREKNANNTKRSDIESILAMCICENKWMPFSVEAF